MKAIALVIVMVFLGQGAKAQLSLQAGWAIIASQYDEKGYGMDLYQGGYATYICSEFVNFCGKRLIIFSVSKQKKLRLL